jgi:hypothetical protein
MVSLIFVNSKPGSVFKILWLSKNTFVCVARAVSFVSNCFFPANRAFIPSTHQIISAKTGDTFL